MISEIYLPIELKNHIASFIPVSEIGMLSSISKNYHAEIPKTPVYQTFILFRGVYRRGARLYNTCRNTLINFAGYFSDVYSINRQL